MTASTPTPTDRASFDSAIAAILADHATLRRLAAAVSKRPDFSSDDAMSLADAVTSHEDVEARLFALPFLTRPPKAVTTTAAEAHQKCLDYTSGKFRVPSAGAAAALFADALLAHLAAEEAWLAREKELYHQRLLANI